MILKKNLLMLNHEPEISQLEKVIHLDEFIIELHNMARKLSLHPLTKNVSAQLRDLGHELSELKRTSMVP